MVMKVSPFHEAMESACWRPGRPLQTTSCENGSETCNPAALHSVAFCCGLCIHEWNAPTIRKKFGQGNCPIQPPLKHARTRTLFLSLSPSPLPLHFPSLLSHPTRGNPLQRAQRKKGGERATRGLLTIVGGARHFHSVRALLSFISYPAQPVSARHGPRRPSSAAGPSFRHQGPRGAHPRRPPLASAWTLTPPAAGT